MAPRIGTSKYPYRDDMEREIIVKQIRKGAPDEDIAAMTGWSNEEVREVRRVFFPTASLAADYLRASSLRLAMRVVEEANVEEAVDILSRPNIGVLEPARKADAGPKFAFMTNITTHTLGSVQPPTVETSILEMEPASCSNPNPQWALPPTRSADPIAVGPVPVPPPTTSPSPTPIRSAARSTPTSNRPSSTTSPRNRAKGKSQAADPIPVPVRRTRTASKARS